MATQTTNTPSRLKRQMAEVLAAQRAAGEEPTQEAMEAAHRVLSGRTTADQVIRDGFAALGTKHV